MFKTGDVVRVQGYGESRCRITKVGTYRSGQLTVEGTIFLQRWSDVQETWERMPPHHPSYLTLIA